MIKNILFDLDGTLIDSHECIFTLYELLFKELNIQLPPKNEMYSFIGPPVEHVLPKFVEKEKVKQTANRFREIYKTIDLEKTNHLFPNVLELLEKLNNDGFNLYICSTKNQQTVEKLSKILGMDKYLKKVYGSFDTIGRFSKLDVINTLFEENGIDINESILIGDTHYDVEGAKKANLKVAIVEYGFGNMDIIDKNDVLFFAKDTNEIYNKIIELNNKRV